MSDQLPVHDDEIDLFELFQTLWGGKWLIGVFVAFSLLLGGSYAFFKTPIYESRINYSVDMLPPYYEEKKAVSDFRKAFYSQNNFDSWKKDTLNSVLIFDDFNNVELVDGFIMSKDEDDQLLYLKSDKDNVHSINIKSDQLPILDDAFQYINYINSILTSGYVQRVQYELEIITNRFNDIAASNEIIIENIIAIDRYVASVENGADVFMIKRPTIPEKISPKSSLILVLSAILGGMGGAAVVLIRHAVKKRKQRMA